MVVYGVSMEPALRGGDLVVTLRQRVYAVGDIVAFPVEGGVVIHRIVGGTAEGGYVTRGDNRSSADLWHPTSQEILGRVWIRVPGAGLWLEAMRRPAAMALLAAFLTLVALLGTLTPRRRRRVMQAWSHSTNPLFWPRGPLPLGLFGVLCLTAGFALAVQAFSRPTELF